MTTKKDTAYIEAVGRRKTAIARVRITPGSKNTITVNGKALEEYFKTLDQQSRAGLALRIEGLPENVSVSVKVLGGGISAQADAIRHGIARALIKKTATLRTELKKAGYLTRDPRAKERKKPGLRKARKRPQWSKR